jgi:hypothetical protein
LIAADFSAAFIFRYFRCQIQPLPAAAFSRVLFSFALLRYLLPYFRDFHDIFFAIDVFRLLLSAAGDALFFAIYFTLCRCQRRAIIFSATDIFGAFRQRRRRQRRFRLFFITIFTADINSQPLRH